MNSSEDTTATQELSSEAAPSKKDKRPNRKKEKSKYTAHTADKYELYQHAVQSPETDIDFLQRVYREINEKEAKHFRERVAHGWELALVVGGETLGEEGVQIAVVVDV